MSSSPESQQALRRLRRWSPVLAAACLALIVVWPVAVAIYWAVAEPASLIAGSKLPPTALQGTILPWQRITGALIMEVPLAMLLIGVWQARKCFRLFAREQIFTSEAVRCLERFAGWAMLSVVAGIAAGAATSILVTVNNPPTMRHLSVSIGSDQLLLLFFAGMVWLMAGALRQGQVLAEENATFV